MQIESQNAKGMNAASPTADAECVRPFLARCPICGSRRLQYAFSKQGYRVVRCVDCRLMLLNPQTSDAELAAIYNDTYFLGDDTPEGRSQLAEMKRATARLYLREIERYDGRHGGALLEIGCGQGDLLLEAQALGYKITGVETSEAAAERARQRLGCQSQILCGDVQSARLTYAQFDVCVLADVIEHFRDPLALLCTVHQLLKPNGILFIATPTLASWSGKLMRENWMEFKPEHLFYFDSDTLQHTLFRAGFHQIIVQPGWKILNLDYVAHHFDRFPVPLITPLLRWATRFSPDSFRRHNLPVVASGMMVMARAAPLPARRKLSVIVPVYNEVGTLDTVLSGLVRKEIQDLDIEIVVVEQNSTDGTREIAQRYADHPRVHLVLQDGPRGKGYAVRTAFEYATGDFILIQDADLEYDMEDYESLLEPLIQCREAFVLGARHGGNAMKMRHFVGNRLLSTALNSAHLFFTALVNLFFGLRLKDPFTMYKVFRRDCLFGLTFECNRFDFDYELLIKLVRKGYRPIEIPVNYRSRSFREGKKVSIWRDPPTWLRALIWLRLAQVDPMREVERQREQNASLMNT